MRQQITDSAQRHPTRTLVIVSVVAVNLLVFGLLWAAGVPLLGGTKAEATADSTALTLIPLASTVDTPAAVVVTKTLDGPIDGVKPAGVRWASSGTPFDRACGSTDGVNPVIAWSRPFTGRGRTVSVQVAAYGAGQGAAGVAQLADRLGDCSGASSYGTTFGTDSTAIIASSNTDVTNATALVWQRADVVVSVTAQGSGTSGLASIAGAVDKRLVELLTPKCWTLAESVADAGRSPWSGEAYTGNLQPRDVPLEYADPSASPTPVLPSSVPVVSVPGPTLAVPTLAPTPTDAALSTALPPTPVLASPLSSDQPPFPVNASPSPPAVPTAPASIATVNEQVADPDGPGCGWNFTLQGAPTFDGEAAQEQYDAAIVTAHEELRTADAEWQVARAGYSLSYAQYAAAVQAFVTYANETNLYVAGLKSSKYERDLAAFEAARAAREVFLQNQEFARLQYENALQACTDAGSATPTPSETPTEDPGLPTDGVTSEPTDGALVCPPEEPAILTELPPVVPRRPQPPS